MASLVNPENPDSGLLDDPPRLFMEAWLAAMEHEQAGEGHLVADDAPNDARTTDTPDNPNKSNDPLAFVDVDDETELAEAPETAESQSTTQLPHRLPPALVKARQEDHLRAGRQWPGMLPTTSMPDVFSAPQVDAWSLAPGEVHPMLLAQQQGERYGLAAHNIPVAPAGEGSGEASSLDEAERALLAHEQLIAPTDVYSVARFGLGLRLMPLDCSQTPEVLGAYHRPLRQIFLDWSTIPTAPTGLAVFSPEAWRDAIDASPLGRLLVAWAVACHLTMLQDAPQLCGFQTLPADALLPETHDRIRRILVAMASLLAPMPRLVQQLADVGVTLPEREWKAGVLDWRAHVNQLDATERQGHSQEDEERAERRRLEQLEEAPTVRLRPLEEVAAEQRATRWGNHTYYQSHHHRQWRDSQPPARREDEFSTVLVSYLAERNCCPALFIEAQLDGALNASTWNHWRSRLLRSLPALRNRAVAVHAALQARIAQLTPDALPNALTTLQYPYTPYRVLRFEEGRWKVSSDPLLML